MAILEGIARGERDYAEGRVLSHAAVKKRMQKRIARWQK
jgi:predicted transcriptional regulator